MTYPSDIHLGRCINIAHSIKDIKKTFMAKAIGVTVQRYSNILKDPNPRIQIALQVCNVLGISLEELISYGNKHDSNK
tara:strand:+ start:222 stop:455 length:234 start_codon:yes stop_codon:yes gene_type:complete